MLSRNSVVALTSSQVQASCTSDSPRSLSAARINSSPKWARASVPSRRARIRGRCLPLLQAIQLSGLHAQWYLCWVGSALLNDRHPRHFQREHLKTTYSRTLESWKSCMTKLIAISALAVALAACGGSGSPTAPTAVSLLMPIAVNATANVSGVYNFTVRSASSCPAYTGGWFIAIIQSGTLSLSIHHIGYGRCVYRNDQRCQRQLSKSCSEIAPHVA